MFHSNIAAQLIWILKIIRLLEKLALKAFKPNNNEVVEDNSSGRANKTITKLFNFNQCSIQDLIR